MRLVIDIPDWAKDRKLVLLAGVEEVAMKKPNEDFLWVKTERCNKCGRCCQPPSLPKVFKTKPNGECVDLVGNYKEFECGLHLMRPRACCESDPVLGGREGAEKWCTCRHRKVPIEK